MINVNELPKFTRWPEILIESELHQKERNIKNIHDEFEVEKWGKLLEEVNKSEKKLTIQEVDRLHIDNSVKTMVFQNNKFEICSISNAHNIYIELIVDYLEPFIKECSAIVDLGCGYGSVILKLAKKSNFSKKKLYAFDYSKSGIEILQKIAHFSQIKIETGLCNFYDTDILKMVVPKDALFFSTYSMFYQKLFPDEFLNNLLQYNPSRIINIEPCYELYDKVTLIGLLSRKYVEYNQYNLNFLSVLKHYQDLNLISIDEVKPLVHGINPLLAASIINWKPVTK